MIEEKESKRSRQVKEAFIAKHIIVLHDENRKGFALICGICGEKILDLRKYTAKTREEFIDILFNHLALYHLEAIHSSANL